MTLFRLIHISDLHIGAVPNRLGAMDRMEKGEQPNLFASHDLHASRLVALKIRDLLSTRLSQRHPIDLLLISGDVATSADPEDLDQARDYIDNVLKLGHIESATLASSRTAHNALNIFAMPGNHDRMTSLGKFGMQTYEEKFEDYWPDEDGYTRSFSARVIKKTISGTASHLAIIGGDLSYGVEQNRGLTSGAANLGKGQFVQRFHGPALRDLTEMLRREYENCCVIWAVHFPPSGLVRDHYRLDYWNELMKLARDIEIPLILSGHIHENKTFSECAPPHVWVSGSACQYKERHGHWINLIEIETRKSELVRALRLPFSLDSGRFSYGWPDATLGPVPKGAITLA
jgi:Icc-related predicted phosphoesterase